jgi:hypothetical protein
LPPNLIAQLIRIKLNAQRCTFRQNQRRHNSEIAVNALSGLRAGKIMISSTAIRGFSVLLALTGVSMTAVRAQQAPPPGVAAIEPDDAEAAAKLDLPEPDWSQLNTSGMVLERPLTPKQASRPATPEAGMAWSEQNKPSGAAVSVKQPLSTFWDARIGADMNVVNQPSAQTNADLLRQKYAADAPPSQSSGTAYAAVTAPGVGAIWDKTAIEARVDPAQDQSKLGTSLSKQLPLGGDQYSLTLQNDYNVTQQSMAPAVGSSGHPARNYQTEQSAKLSIADTGTSFIAGQSMSSTDEKWTRKIGAEQKLFGEVSVAGTISENPQGATNRSLTAGFKHSW